MSDLDDFFAKKDKKKSKVKKFTASDLLTSSAKPQQAEDVAPPKKQPVKREEPIQEQPAQPGDEPAAPVKAKPVEDVEEEWGEFEQEKERDYSGLKIQKLQIQDYEEEEGDEYADHELNEEGELIKRENAGPWNKISNQAAPTSVAKPVAAAPIEQLPNTAGGVYIPPSKRNQATAAPAAKGKGKKEKGAPDLNSEEFFPTLSAAVAIEQNNYKLKKFEQTERGFTEAKPSRSHSSRNALATDEGPRLNLGNKFTALSNDD